MLLTVSWRHPALPLIGGHATGTRKVVDILNRRLEAVKDWAWANELRPNPGKTELLSVSSCIDSGMCLQSVPGCSIPLEGSELIFDNSVSLLN